MKFKNSFPLDSWRNSTNGIVHNPLLMECKQGRPHVAAFGAKQDELKSQMHWTKFPRKKLACAIAHVNGSIHGIFSMSIS